MQMQIDTRLVLLLLLDTLTVIEPEIVKSPLKIK